MALTGGAGILVGDVVSLSVGKRTYQIAVPHHSTDYIQGRIAATGRPYEHEMLAAMLTLLAPGELVVDVGANVGNHAIFLAAIGDLRVVAYEPNSDLTAALARSIDLNGLHGRVDVRSAAVGATPGRGVLTALNPANLGGQHVTPSDDGDFTVVALDLEALPAPVSALKIDVEGMELEVLQGAAELIGRDRPLIFVECQEVESFDQVGRWLVEHGYGYIATYNATPTHLFRPAHGVEGDLEFRSAALSRVAQWYRDSAKQRELAEELNSVRLKYRDLAHRNGKLKERVRVLGQTTQDAVARAKHEEANLRLSYDRARHEAVKYREMRDAHAKRAEALERRLALVNKNSDALQATVNRLRSGRALRTVRTLRAARSPRRLLLLPRDLWRVFRPVRQQLASRPVAARPQPGAKRPARHALGPSRLAADRIYHSAELLERSRSAEASSAGLRSALANGGRTRVAAIVDDFTRQSLALECDLRDLHPASWRSELEEFEPHILFVESAWRGESGTWHNTVPKFVKELEEVISWCRERGVPTVFWNKEDPVHFRTFLRTAAEFDHVFTTDLDMVNKYRALLGHERVRYLGFACQPRIQNPIEVTDRKEALVFAGGYYLRYKERMRDLKEILNGVSDVMPLEIYDRMLGTTLKEYAFPAEYARYIVGTLAPSEIDVAYKGYRYALNLNSVKSSQTMFARRIYELLSSGTLTVSNYARGLSNVFGELVPMSDSEIGARALLTRLVEDRDRADKLRVMGLRKVHSKHTYADRLAYVLDVASGRPLTSREFVVTAVFPVASVDEVKWAREVAATQRGVRLETMFVTDDPAARGELEDTESVVLSSDVAGAMSLGDLVGDSSGIALLDPRDWYGDFYLLDLALACQYSDAAVIGKADHFALKDGALARVSEGSEYRATTGLDPRRSLVRTSAGREVPCSMLFRGGGSGLGEVAQLAIHRFDYCRDGAHLGPEVIAELSGDLSIDTGLDDFHQTAPPSLSGDRRFDETPTLPLDALRTPAGATGELTATPLAKGLRIDSCLGESAHEYLWTSGRLDCVSLWPDGTARVLMETGSQLDLEVALRFYDAGGQLLGSAVRPSDAPQLVPVPSNAREVSIGIRVKGPGRRVVWSIILGDVDFGPLAIPSKRDVVVVTDNYPAYGDLYRNGFVHRRVAAYGESGLTSDVFRLVDGATLAYREFEGVEVGAGGQDSLYRLLTGGAHDAILVHFLSPSMWNVIRHFQNTHRVVIWVHGSEVQPWWRRTFNFPNEEVLERAKVTSAARLEFWRGVIRELGGQTHLVFVSQYFADEVMEDLGVSIPAERVSVIHNPVDTSLFGYSVKSPDARRRVLSIRPYASAKYANDLAVAAVLELASRPCFGELHFRFVGDGALFDDTLKPLRNFPNVTIERRFLRQDEIAELHRDYGIFLVPTRMDAQGVSRDEAMASGLVPVTNAVACIPEFVDNACGYLAESEDHMGLAAGIERAFLHPEEFLQMSSAAAARVREQSGVDVVIPKELALIRANRRATV